MRLDFNLIAALAHVAMWHWDERYIDAIELTWSAPCDAILERQYTERGDDYNSALPLTFIALGGL